MAEYFRPINLASMLNSMLEGGKKVVEVKAIGSFMALITFESGDAMEEALHRDSEWLLSFFNECNALKICVI